MEKLLLFAKEKGRKDGNFVTGRRKKISSLAMAATKIFFATARQKTLLINLIQDDLS